MRGLSQLAPVLPSCSNITFSEGNDVGHRKTFIRNTRSQVRGTIQVFREGAFYPMPACKTHLSSVERVITVSLAFGCYVQHAEYSIFISNRIVSRKYMLHGNDEPGRAV